MNPSLLIKENMDSGGNLSFFMRGIWTRKKPLSSNTGGIGGSLCPIFDDYHCFEAKQVKEMRGEKGHGIRVQGFGLRSKESAEGFGVQRVRLKVQIFWLGFKGFD